MRLALIIPAFAALAACGGQPESAGPERRSAAGEVLGGEVTDDMLPLDTVKSTSPADRRADAPGSNYPVDEIDRNPGALPKPEVSGGPGGRQPADIEPADTPTPE